MELCELQCKLLKGGFIGDCIGFTGASRGLYGGASWD